MRLEEVESAEDLSAWMLSWRAAEHENSTVESLLEAGAAWLTDSRDLPSDLDWQFIAYFLRAASMYE